MCCADKMQGLVQARPAYRAICKICELHTMIYEHVMPDRCVSLNLRCTVSMYSMRTINMRRQGHMVGIHQFYSSLPPFVHICHSVCRTLKWMLA